MDFSNTPHVLVHTEISPTGHYLGFFGRCLVDQLLKCCNRAGVLILPEELRDDPPAAVAVAISCPDIDWVRVHLPRLLEREVVALSKDGAALILPRYHDGQYGNMSPSLMSRMSRMKYVDTEFALKKRWIRRPRWYKEKLARSA